MLWLKFLDSGLCSGLFSLCRAWSTLQAVSSGSLSSQDTFLAADSGRSKRLFGPGKGGRERQIQRMLERGMDYSVVVS